MDRAKIITDKKFLPMVKKQIFNILRENAYPQTLLNKLWYAKPTLNNNKDIEVTNNQKTEILKQTHMTDFLNSNTPNHTKSKTRPIINNYRYHKLNYIPNLTNKITNAFKKYDHDYIKFGLYNNNKIKNYLSKTKDKINILNRTDVIYKLECSCNKVYIGETSQWLSNRIKQHISDCKNVNKTALADHSIYNQHSFNFNKVKILDTESSTKARRHLESIYITKNI